MGLLSSGPAPSAAMTGLLAGLPEHSWSEVRVKCDRVSEATAHSSFRAQGRDATGGKEGGKTNIRQEVAKDFFLFLFFN